MFEYDLRLSMWVLFVDGLLYLHGQQETNAVRLKISSPQLYRFQVKSKKKRNILPEFKNKITFGSNIHKTPPIN